MFTKSSPQLSMQFPLLLIIWMAMQGNRFWFRPQNGVLCRCCLSPGIVLQAVIVWGCDVMWFVFRERRRCGLLRMESRFFILVLIPLGQAARGERETSPLKWVYSRLFADQKNLVQDANGWDLSVRIKSARQLCYCAPFTDIKFKQTYSPKHFY